MMPRDFLADNNEPEMNNNLVPRDFLSEESSQPTESLGTSAYLSPFRIAEDIGRGGMEFIKKIPDYYESAKTQFPGIINLLKDRPGRVGSQLAAGLTELGHGALNVPHDISGYLENRLNLLPKGTTQHVPYQKDISNDINELFGAPQYAGDVLARGIGKNIANVAGGKAIASALNPMNLTYKSIAKDIVKTGKENQQSFSKKYNKLFNEAEKKDFDNLSSVISQIDMPIIKKYTPHKKIVYLEDFLKDPSLRTAHRAKSDLIKVRNDLEKKTSFTGGEQKQYTAVTDAINDIEKNMFVNKQGIPDLKMQDKYRNITKGYAKDVGPYKNDAIAKYKKNKLTEEELVKRLSGGEFRVKKGSQHPQIYMREKLSPALKLAGAGGIGAYLYHLLSGNKEQ